MKTLLKIFLILVCLAPELVEGQVNTSTRQLRFYPVRAAADTAATAGNSGRMWYDFVSNQFRGNVGGTNFTFGSGGGSGDMILSATQTNTGIKTFAYINPTINAGYSTFRLGRTSVIPAGSVPGDIFMSEGPIRGLYFNNDNVFGLVYRQDISLPNVGTIPFFTGSENGLMNTNTSFTFISSVLNVPGKGQFTGSTARAGINLGGFAGDVSSPTNADMWYNSTTNNFRGRIGGASDSFAFLAASQTFTNKTLSTGTVFSSAPTINDGLKFTFNPNGTNAGLNVGAHTSAPSSPQNADLYYNSTSNELFARINGVWVSLGAGGSFTNGAANNELIKSDGTNGVGSGIFSTSNGSAIFGTSGLSGDRRITVDGSDSNVNLEILTKGTGYIDLQNTSLGSTYMRLRYLGSSSGVEVASGIGFFRTNDRGNNANTFAVRIESGDGLPAGTFTNTGNVHVTAGTPFGTGTKGNVIIGSKTAPSSFEGLQGGMYLRNSIASATDGLEDGVAFSAEDVGGFSELYLISERGAKINATGLFEPVQATGTSFTFDYSHLSKLVVGNNAATITATVPVLQVGYITKVVQDGAGVMNLSAGTNVVLVGKTSTSFIGDTIVIHAYKTSGSDTYYLCE